MNISLDLSNKSFAIYGLGSTGQSIIKYFKKLGIKNYVIWDDNKALKSYWRLNKKKENLFFKFLNFADYIIVSPGINLKKNRFRNVFLKNKHKIITDLDLFYMTNPKIKSIVVTGTNGKSTTCKIIEHILKKNGFQVKLGGNIGNPILDLKVKKNSTIIIEASSFQLFYSKFVKPNYAIILNISNDHLDWHGSMNNYILSKMKIFSLQNKSDFAFINNKNLIKKFRSNKYLSKLKIVKLKIYEQIKNRIKNNYLSLEANVENMSFVYALSRNLKINKNLFIKSCQSFKGLEHRHEIFYKKKNKVFINDSKATTFEATKFALKNNKNIFWIVGGQPKIGEKFKLKKIKKNIIKTYIIGKHMKIFVRHLKKNVKFQLCKTLTNATCLAINDSKNIINDRSTILLSPSSASYDQFRNFEERGNQFKKLVKNYLKKNY